MIDILLIGAGKWGQNYISTIKSFPDIELIVANRNNWKNLINEVPRGVIIATPPESHIEIASYALEKHIPVVIEKPLGLSLNEANILKKYAQSIIVNHIHLFSTSYQNLKKHQLNSIDKIVSVGGNNGPIRNYSSLIDYGSHDISMILDFTRKLPIKLECQEFKQKNGSIYHLIMYFNNFATYSLIGNGFKNSNRKFEIYSDKICHSYNDFGKEDPRPLNNMIKVFIDLINGDKDDRVGLGLSLNIMRILELAVKSMKGQKVVYL